MPARSSAGPESLQGVVQDGPPAGAKALPSRRLRALDVLARPEGSFALLADLGVPTELPPSWAEALEVRVRYRGYIEREQVAARRARSLDERTLPRALWFGSLHGLSNEAREKLLRWRPVTVGQAARIAGVSPSDVAVLLILAGRAGAANADAD